MESKDPSPDPWNDDEKTVFHLPSASPAVTQALPIAELLREPETPSRLETPSSAEEGEGQSEEPDISFPWHPSSDGPAAAPGTAVSQEGGAAFVAPADIPEEPFDRTG